MKYEEYLTLRRSPNKVIDMFIELVDICVIQGDGYWHCLLDDCRYPTKEAAYAAVLALAEVPAGGGA
jgi:hypothetical protein